MATGCAATGRKKKKTKITYCARGEYNFLLSSSAASSGHFIIHQKSLLYRPLFERKDHNQWFERQNAKNMGRTDLLNIINGYPVTERILLVEAILKQIREEERSQAAPEETVAPYSGAGLLEFAGALSDEEADNMQQAILEARKINT